MKIASRNPSKENNKVKLNNMKFRKKEILIFYSFKKKLNFLIIKILKIYPVFDASALVTGFPNIIFSIGIP
jgi:hypothetical protein